MDHDPTLSNEEAFFQTFYQQIDRDAFNWPALLKEFYEKDFDLIGKKHGSMEQFASWVDTLPFCVNPASVVEPGRVDRQASQRAYEQNVKLAADERAVLRQETQKSLDRDKAEG